MLRFRSISTILVIALLATGIVFDNSPQRAHASQCAVSSFASGTGTSADPYVLLTEQHFRNVKFCDGSSVYFSLRNDLDLGGSATPLDPFGATSPFLSHIRGEVFDGVNTNSAVIEGIYVEGADAAPIKQMGAGASVTDLQLSGDVRGTSGSVAGLVSQVIPSSPGTVTIESVTSSITVEGTGSTARVAGLVGLFNTSTAGVQLLISGSAVVFANGGGSISSTNAIQVGGMVARAQYSTNPPTLRIENSSVNTVITLENSDTTMRTIGGVVGHVFGGHIQLFRVGSSSLIQSSVTANAPTKLGGLIGQHETAGTLSIQESYFDGLIKGKGRVQAGGFTASTYQGTAPVSISISNSYTVGTIIQDTEFVDSSKLTYFGGLAGLRQEAVLVVSDVLVATQLIVDPDKSRAGAIFGASSINDDFSTSDLFYNTSREAASTSNKVGPVFSATQGSVTGGTAIDYTQQVVSSTFNSNFSSSIWGYCPEPYLLWQGTQACNPRVTGGRITNDGSFLEIFLSQPVSDVPNSGERFPLAQDVVAITRNGAALSLTGRLLPGSTSRSVLVALPDKIAATDEVAFSYTDPSTNDESQADALEAISGGRDVQSRALVLTANTSKAQLKATISNPVALPTSISVEISCLDLCGDGTAFEYVASITPSGGAERFIQGTANVANQIVSFDSLTPNVTHTIRASVVYNGQRSATVSRNVATPRPVATISALSIADTSATLTVGCTNCGSSPDSFTISATPQAGGPAITSSTNVVSGLTSETTYSFAVVISFAGVQSTSVNWQSNPVRTLPFVPIISTVSPSMLPLTGGSVTVTGTNFTTSTEVLLDGATVSFTVVNGTTITFTAPAKLAGAYDLSITNPVGTGSLASAMTYVNGPRITATSPAVGTVNGGTLVTITGTDLALTSEVALGSTTVSFSVISDTLVRFVTPASTASVVDVTVTSPGGSTTSPAAFEYTTSALVPVIASITPASGPTAGGTTITVTGQYFSGSYSDSVSAAINGVSGSSIVLIDDSTLTFLSPGGAAATGLDVSVATGGGVGTLAGVFSYTAPPTSQNAGGGGSSPVALNTPEITNFSKRTIAASGDQVTATGLRLSGISTLTLGGITVTIVSNTDTSLVFSTGEMPVGVWDLRLVGASGTLVYQSAISVVDTAIVSESTGELIGWSLTLRFIGNSRSLNEPQVVQINAVVRRQALAETVICWGYTTAENPKPWAIAHATARAKAACDQVLANNSQVKTIVRLRYGVPKDFAMRAALQFWK